MASIDESTKLRVAIVRVDVIRREFGVGGDVGFLTSRFCHLYFALS